MIQDVSFRSQSVAQILRRYFGVRGDRIGIRKGELVTLLGPSGCGKSTLLRALAGLTPVDGGQVRVAGEDITWQAPQKRGIGMVFQSYALFPNMTVWTTLPSASR